MDDDDLQRMKEISSYDSYKFDDFSDSFMNVYDESTPNVFDLEGCGEESPYSGPILQDIESPLSIYGGENHHNADVSAAPFADSFTMFNSLCTKASSPQLSFTSCSESHSLPISPSFQENAKSTLPISKRQLFGNFVMEKNGPPEIQNSGFSSYHGTSSLDSYRSFPSSINELLYRKLHPPKSESNYLLKIRCPENHKDDGYKWRKYGQKAIKNSPYPRSYYRCTSPKCRAKKQVEKCVEDPQTLTITYEGLHLHYSYSPLMQITQQPNCSLRQPENNIYERIIKRKALTETIWNESFKNSSKSPAMVAAHQQLQKEKDGLFESLQFGREKSDIIIMDGVVEEEYGGGRRDGLLQDIVPLGIINPLSSSSSSSTSSSASQ